MIDALLAGVEPSEYVPDEGEGDEYGLNENSFSLEEDDHKKDYRNAAEALLKKFKKMEEDIENLKKRLSKIESIEFYFED